MHGFHRPPRFLTASIDMQRKAELEGEIQVHSSSAMSFTEAVVVREGRRILIRDFWGEHDFV